MSIVNEELPIATGHARSKTQDEDSLNPFDSIAVPVTSRVKQVWAIGGGKGGVGKSLVCSGFAPATKRLP